MKVMILAAGEGRRLLPLTESIPKPLLKVGGKYLIERHIERLVAAGFSGLVINLFHLGQQIELALGDGTRLGAQISYARENRLLGTGAGIANAIRLLGQDDFIVVNADVYTEFDFSGIGSLRCGELGHLVMVDNPTHHPDGDFAIGENSQLRMQGECLTYSGIGVLSPRLFTECDSVPLQLRDILVPAICSGELTGEHYRGTWFDVGTVDRYEELRSRLG